MDEFMNHLTKDSDHRIIELSARGGTVPIRCFGGKRFLPDDAARLQLDEVAALEGVEDIAVLPDVHHKIGNPSPSGTVVVTSGVILPRAVDDGMNCGMRSMATDLSARDLTPEVIDRLFGRLLETVPPRIHATPLVNAADCEEMLVHGLEMLVDPLDLPPDEVARTENGGRIDLGIEPEAVRAALPKKRIQKYCGSIGTLGTGNHFLELQEVVEICDPEAARLLDLKEGQVMFMMHTASAKLGKCVLAQVHAEAEQMFRAPGASELFSIPVDSEIGQRYLACMTGTLHAGFANRAAITALVRRALRDVLGHGSGLRLVGDCGHETIQPELHGGRKVWVHRHGASHALPPGKVADPELRELGLPVPVAGCLGMDSYVCLGRPGNESTFHALPHGAGRVLGKEASAERFDPTEVQAEIENRGVRLYRYGSDNIAGQAPWGFKNVAHVVDAMVAMDLGRPVVRVRPLAALKG
jgi:tRNA-splicing ligase RtcB